MKDLRKGFVLGLKGSKDEPGMFVTIGDEKDTVCQLFKKGDKQEINKVNTKQLEHYSINSAPNHNLIAICSWTPDIKILSINKKSGLLEQVFVFTGHQKKPNTVGFERQGKFALSVGSDQTLILWALDLEVGHCGKKDSLDLDQDVKVAAIGTSYKDQVYIALCYESKISILKWDSKNSFDHHLVIEGAAVNPLSKLDFHYNEKEHSLYLLSSAF
jgi:WD40 repeat protein